MARQFDVCRVKGLRAESPVDLAVVLQDDALSHLTTRVVAPLVPASAELAVDRAMPQVEIAGTRYVVAVHLLMTVPDRNLETLVATLKEHERTLKNAIDMVFFGV